MRTEEEIRRALEIMQRAMMTAFVRKDEVLMDHFSVMLGVLSWVVSEELGESLQRIIGQFDTATDKAAVN